jgi:3-oxoacid CoA-transferase subunit A
MTYITGDKHRSFEDITDFCREYETTEEDVLIILGDVGINYLGEPYDTELKVELAKLPLTLLCVHGNHEMRPESIASYEEEERFGGVVYMEPDFPNLLFAKDGEVYTLSGKRCMAIGGAYSVDRAKRTPGKDWWADEQPSDAVMRHVESRLELLKWKVDAVLSHTCPKKYMPTEYFLPMSESDRKWVDTTTEEWLDELEGRLKYREWWCGHFHAEKFDHKMRFLFQSIMDFNED